MSDSHTRRIAEAEEERLATRRRVVALVVVISLALLAVALVVGATQAERDSNNARHDACVEAGGTDC